MEGNEKIRLREFIAYKGETVKQFEEKIGRANGYFNNTSFQLPKSFEPITRAYPDLNIGWVLTGEGDMIRGRGGSATFSPYFDNFSVEGGAASGFGNESALVPDGYMSVPGVGNESTIFLRVRGNSMINYDDPGHSIPDGSLVALREVKSSSLRWGEVYAFMTIDGPVVKRVFESEDQECIVCASFNERDGFKPFLQPKKEICGPFYRVTDVVRINHF